MKLVELMIAESPAKMKSWLTKQLADNGIRTTGSSRGGMHIRFPLNGELQDFANFFNKFGIDVAESPTTISGTFDTYTLTLRQENEVAPIGTTLSWVNNYVGKDSKIQKTFGPKELTPDTFGLADVRVDASQIISQVDNTLREKYPEHYEQLMQIAKLSASKGNNISLSGVDLSSFSKSDIATISKNFGEVLAGLWTLTNLGFGKIYFPRTSNTRMIDFYGERMKLDYPVSVKSAGGGKVSITNILDALEDKVKQGKVNPSEQACYMLFKIIQENSAKEGIVRLHAYFKTDPIKQLAGIMGISIEEITLTSINEWLSNFESKEEIKKATKPLLDTMNTRITDAIWDREDRLRFIISPMGEWLWKSLNENDEIRDSMSQLARKLQMMQVNVDIKNSTLIFSHNSFRKAEFIFGWAGYTAGNKLGFKMKLN